MKLSLELWLPPLAAGLALLIVSALWRSLARANRRNRARATLRAALVDPDPMARLAAVHVAVQQGIAPVAASLLEATRTEQHPAVLAGIMDAVARHQWEPSLEPELVDLRLWAQRRLLEQTGYGRRNGAAPHETHAEVRPPGVLGRLLGEPARRRSRTRG